MCGLHALNNALQYSFFTSNFLIQIAKNLQIKEEQLYYDLSNVDKNIYSNSFGNFNSEVLVTALEKKNFEVKRYNEVINTGLYIVCNGYHWFAIRKFYDSGPIWDLDSLGVPKTIESSDFKLLNKTIFKIFPPLFLTLI